MTTQPISPLTLGLVALAAIMHAAWNILLKTSSDPLVTSAKAMGAAAIACAPLGLAAWLFFARPSLPVTAVAVALVSSVVELCYFAFLSEAYRRGDLSEVYPLARGTAPILAAIAGIFFLGEPATLASIAGILLLLSGIWLVRRPRAAGNATTPALATGLSIATYSTLDKVGVGLVTPWLYGWLMWTATAVWLALFAWARGRRTSKAAIGQQSTDTPWGTALTVGVLMTTAYLFVLFALSVAPVSLVSPLRESAVVLVALWGVWRLHERHGAAMRLAGAFAILLGAAVLAIL